MDLSTSGDHSLARVLAHTSVGAHRRNVAEVCLVERLNRLDVLRGQIAAVILSNWWLLM